MLITLIDYFLNHYIMKIMLNLGVKKSVAITLVVFISLFIVGGSVFAATPTIPTEGLPSFGELVAWIFTWSLNILGIVVFVMIFYAGFQWFTAAGNTAKVNEARGQITNAITGAIILLAAYIILYTINPDLVKGTFTLPGTDNNSQNQTNSEISSLNQNSGSVGTEITIRGDNFSPTNNTVKFGNGYIKNLASNADGTSITFTVPDELDLCPPDITSCAADAFSRVSPGETYTVFVLIANQPSNAVEFRVATVLPPRISSLNLTRGSVGTPITITGLGFAPTNNTVKFGNGYIKNLASNADGTSITFTVPSELDPCPPDVDCAGTPTPTPTRTPCPPDVSCIEDTPTPTPGGDSATLRIAPSKINTYYLWSPQGPSYSESIYTYALYDSDGPAGPEQERALYPSEVTWAALDSRLQRSTTVDSAGTRFSWGTTSVAQYDTTITASYKGMNASIPFKMNVGSRPGAGRNNWVFSPGKLFTTLPYLPYDSTRSGLKDAHFIMTLKEGETKTYPINIATGFDVPGGELGNGITEKLSLINDPGIIDLVPSFFCNYSAISCDNQVRIKGRAPGTARLYHPGRFNTSAITLTEITVTE
jgi:predicted PurR-regulated permease PerM